MEWIDLGMKPISEASRAGEDIQYDPAFEELEAEINKMYAPTAASSLDWSKVVDLAGAILAQKSKHLMVAGYLSLALLKTRGLAGLEESLRMFRKLLETFWPLLFPPLKRMRGRKNAIEWWAEKVQADLANRTPVEWPAERRARCLDDLQSIDAFLAANMEEAPLLHPLFNRLGDLIVVPAAAPEPPPPQPAATPPPAPKAAPAAPPAAEPTVEGDPERLLRQALEQLGRTAGALLSREPLTALPLRLARIAAWSALDALPPAVDGKTRIPAPDKQTVATITNLYHAANWRDLVRAAESRIGQFLFWIDLSRYAAEALEQSGQPELAEAVADETAAFIRRLPGVEKLAFADGTLFANDDTRQWLQSVAHPSAAPARPAARSEDGNVETLVDLQIQEAMKLVRDNKIASALDMFSARINVASTVRERFAWELGLCRLLVTAKKTRLAVPYIQDILAMIDAHRLEKWEPDLAVEALVVAFTGLRSQGDKKDEPLQETVLNRIAALNPSKALELMQ
jgi:type VI secretion system protein VasJ